MELYKPQEQLERRAAASVATAVSDGAVTAGAAVWSQPSVTRSQCRCAHNKHRDDQSVSVGTTDGLVRRQPSARQAEDRGRT